MGLDIRLVELVELKSNGDFLTLPDTEEKYNWEDGRYVIRHKFLEVVEFDCIYGFGNYFDVDPLMRPTEKGFNDGYLFAKSLDNEGESEYCLKILDILKSNTRLYLQCNR